MDLILVSRCPTRVEAVSRWAADRGWPLWLVYSGDQPFFLADRSQVLMFHHSGSLYPILREITVSIRSQFFYLTSDPTIDSPERIDSLLKIAPTIPRLASLSVSLDAGLRPVESNPFYGTLYTQRLFSRVATWGGDDPDSVRVWSRAMIDQGWIHMTIYDSR